MPANIILERIFNFHSRTPSDIHEHLPTLRGLASRCKTIAEIGSWRGMSASALLIGLQDGSGQSLTCVDKNKAVLDQVWGMLSPHIGDVNLSVLHIDSLEVELPEMDFLFIDSWHCHHQLTAELERHGDKAQKLLAFHDTVSFGRVSEDGSTPGLIHSIEQFMFTRPHWEILEHYENNNGLMILHRAPQ